MADNIENATIASTEASDRSAGDGELTDSGQNAAAPRRVATSSEAPANDDSPSQAIQIGFDNMASFEEAMRLVRAGSLDINFRDEEYGAPLIAWAANYRKLDDIQYCMDRGVGIDTASIPHNSTPLSFAAEAGWEEGVRFLLDQGADVTIVDGDGDTALLCAAKANSIKVLEYLVDANSDINARNKTKETTLLRAAEEGLTESVTWLLQHGAEVDAVDKYSNTPLIAAVLEGRDEVVKVLIAHKANIHAVNKAGSTAILLAALEGYVSTFEILLQHGAKVSDRAKEGSSAMHAAASSGSLALVKRCVEAGLDINDEATDHTLPIGWAAFAGRTDIVEWLLNQGTPIDMPANWTPLFSAAVAGQLATCVALLARGANINQTTRTGLTVLMGAINSGNIEVAEMLVNRGANVAVVSPEKVSALSCAAGKANVTMVELLLQRGAKVEAGECLVAATAAKSLEILQMFLSRLPDAQPGTTEGDAIKEQLTDALTEAAALGDMGIGRALLDAHAPGSTEALEHALKNKHFEFAKMLIETGKYAHQQALFAAINASSPEILALLLERDPTVNYNLDALYVLLPGAEPYLRGFTAPNNVSVGYLHYSPLHACGLKRVASNRVEMARLLLDKGADINVSNKEGDTPLDYALNADAADLCKVLLDRGATTSTSICLSACRYPGCLEEMLLHGADPNAINQYGVTMLSFSINKGLASAIPILLRHGADITKKYVPGENKTLSMMELAVRGGNPEIIKALKAAGADIMEEQQSGQTLLHVAAGVGEVTSIDTLIELGMDVDILNNKGATALHMAVRNQRVAVMKALLGHGASAAKTDSYGDLPMIAALDSNTKNTDTALEMIELLLAKGSPVDTVNAENLTPLMIACLVGYTKRAERLIKAGANVNTVGHQGLTALLYAVAKDNIKLVSLLLIAGADAKVANEDGNTGLHLAGYTGCSGDIITMLLRSGADPNALNKDSESPLTIAVRGARIDYMIRLMKMKAKVDDHGSTVVHVAAKHGLKDILQFFNRMGIDTNQPDDNGVTPLQIARAAGHEHVVRALSTGDPFMGWMAKLGEGLVFAFFKRRWFALDDGKLSYFESPEAQKAGAPPIKGNSIPVKEHALHVSIPDGTKQCMLRLMPLSVLVNRPNYLTSLVPNDVRTAYQGAPVVSTRIWTFRVDLEVGEAWFDAFVAHGATALIPFPRRTTDIARVALQLSMGVELPPTQIRMLTAAPGRTTVPGVFAGGFMFPVDRETQAPDFRVRNHALLTELGFSYASTLPSRKPEEQILRPRSEIVCRLAAVNAVCRFVCGGGFDAKHEDAEKAKEKKANAGNNAVPEQKADEQQDAEASDDDENGPDQESDEEESSDEEEEAEEESKETEDSASDDNDSDPDEIDGSKSEKSAAKPKGKLSKAQRMELALAMAHKEEATLRALFARQDIAAVLSSSDRAIVAMKRGDAFKEYVGMVGWHMEYMVVLAWALGHSFEPKLDGEMITGKPLHTIMHDFAPETVEELDAMLADTTLRSIPEIVEMEDRFYCAHNAIRGAERSDGRNVPVGFAPGLHGGVVWERRHALTWMLSPGVAWDATDEST